MDERVVQFRVGVVVLSTAIITMILIVLFSDGSWLPWAPGEYKIYVTFESAPGVSVGSPVRRNGVRIGEVEAVTFTNDRRVKLTLGIRSKYTLYSDEECQIRSGLLGDSAIEFVPAPKSPSDHSSSAETPGPGGVRLASALMQPGGAPPSAPRPLQPGAEIEGVTIASPVDVLTNLQDDLAGAAKAIEEAGQSFTSAGKSVDELAGRLNKILADNDQQINQIMDDLAVSLKQFGKTLDSIDQVIGDQKVQEDLREALSEMPKTLAEARKTFSGLQDTVKVVERNFKNLEGFTGPLGERGPDIVARAESTVEQLDTILTRFAKLSESLENQDSSIGRLMNDPELYDNVNRAVVNIEQLTRRMKPIVEDVRVIADKLARDPSIMGVRGAFRRPSGIK